jgi:glyoxylase-like metal-dependent hydrolase (beta-lactamase superfamily II)
MELKQIAKRVYYFPSQVNIGVITYEDKSAVLIDSGLDEEAGRKILKALEEKGLSLKAIVNTHSHADHCGGNSFLKRKQGVKIYAPEVESAIIQFPCLEPFYLFSGASPPNELKNKFLMAQPSEVDYIIKKNERKLRFGETDLEIVPLPGHSPNQIGIGAEGVLFCADAVFSQEVLRKHKIPFYADVDKARETLEFLRGSGYNLFVPSHAQPMASIEELAKAHLEAIGGIEKHVLENCKQPKTAEEITRQICNIYSINLSTVQQYFLMKTAITAYLSSLHERKKLKNSIIGNSMTWETESEEMIK